MQNRYWKIIAMASKHGRVSPMGIWLLFLLLEFFSGICRSGKIFYSNSTFCLEFEKYYGTKRSKSSSFFSIFLPQDLYRDREVTLIFWQHGSTNQKTPFFDNTDDTLICPLWANLSFNKTRYAPLILLEFRKNVLSTDSSETAYISLQYTLLSSSKLYFIQGIQCVYSCSILWYWILTAHNIILV